MPQQRYTVTVASRTSAPAERQLYDAESRILKLADSFNECFVLKKDAIPAGGTPLTLTLIASDHLARTILRGIPGIASLRTTGKTYSLEPTT